jgi:aromatic ring-opening dioxygenase LigB subunit
MRSMAAAVAASAPDTIVFFTPHGNVFADAVSALMIRNWRVISDILVRSKSGQV